jgi:hypothetical protein
MAKKTRKFKTGKGSSTAQEDQKDTEEQGRPFHQLEV